MKMIPHDRRQDLEISAAEYQQFVVNFFEHELISDGNDRTTQLLFGSQNISATGKVLVKGAGVLAGRAEVEMYLREKYEGIDQEWFYEDGDALKEGDILAVFSGKAAVLLKLERVLLNFLSRMCGIATKTAELTQMLPRGVFLAATRKTLWGLLDKKAVTLGGGLSHRLNLSDAVLVKNNHLSLLPEGVSAAAERITSITASEQELVGNFWEIEVATAEEFQNVLAVFLKNPPHFPGVLMFDNFAAEDIAAHLKKVPAELRKIITFEASGGITPQNMDQYARTGVEVLSLGMLTNAGTPLDLSFRLKRL
jgi:nicotinate-nucleotide pyrophosphorylase (carboxylating)